MSRILVCGSRSVTDRAWMEEILLALFLGPDVTIVHGDAEGADRLAASIAEQHGTTVEAHPADWKNLGRRAGIVRNLAMLDTRPDMVVAFWDGESRGTKHTLDEARRRGIPTLLYGAAS